MAPRTLTPPAAREEQTHAAPVAPTRAPLTAAPRRSPTGRVTRRALVLSVVLHVVLGIGVLLIPVIRPQPAAPPRPEAEPVQYLDIAAFPGEAAAAGDAPGLLAAPADQPDTASTRRPGQALLFPDRVPAGLPAAAPGGDAPASVGQGGAPRAGAAGGRLGAQLGDSRLVVPDGVPVERTLTDQEVYQERLRQRLGVINDSVADEADRRRRQRNWTIRDRGGREWGFGEDGSTIIAGRRVPLPLPLPPIQRDRDADNAERERVRRWGEIRDQAETQDRDAVLRERAGETRRRVDNERRRQRGEAAADTTRRAP